MTLDDPREAAESGVSKLQEKARGILSWLPEQTCDDCGGRCEESVTYDPQQCSKVNSWVCTECGSEFYREDYDGRIFR